MFTRKELFRNLYSDFLAEIVIKHIFKKSELERPVNILGVNSCETLPPETQEKIDKKLFIDIRVPALMRISGKGGYHLNPELRAKYAANKNVTLLDHLVSVVRGTLAFYVSSLQDLSDPKVMRNCAKLIVIAFLHDADKILQLERSENLTAEDVAILVERFGIKDFLDLYNIQWSSEQILALISKVETTRDGYMRPGETLPSREDAALIEFITLADRLDGCFSSSEPIEKIRKIINDADSLPTVQQLFSDIDFITISDPLHPFVNEEILQGIITASENLTGLPPLFAMHHDGEVNVSVSMKFKDEILEQALELAGHSLQPNMMVNINIRGGIDIIGNKTTLEELTNYYLKKQSRSGKALIFEKKWVDSFPNATDFFREIGCPLIVPDLDNYDGSTFNAWKGLPEDDSRYELINRAALVKTLLSCTDVDIKALNIPKVIKRTEELTDFVSKYSNNSMPDCIEDADVKSHKHSIRSALSIYAVYLAKSNKDADRDLFGKDGLCDIWLNGCDGRGGLNDQIEPVDYTNVVKEHFFQIINGLPIRADDEMSESRCHFTNRPMTGGTKAGINGKTKLYNVKVSAFSGREGRPEFFNKTKSETLVSPISKAEHFLRFLKSESSKSSDLAIYISSPSCTGLFGGITLDEDNDSEWVRLTQFVTADLKKATFNDEDGLKKRVFVGRYDTMPDRLYDDFGQVDFIRVVVQAAQRFGRPIHVFKGLPHKSNAFVYFDSLPATVEQALGGREFRIEQLSRVAETLDIMSKLGNDNNFGVSMAQKFADPKTRFSTLCEIRTILDRMSDNDGNSYYSVSKYVDSNLIKMTSNQGGLHMSKFDRALINFGEAMAYVQRLPNYNDGANIPEQGMRHALAAVEELRNLKSSDPEALIGTVYSYIEREFSRDNIFISAAKRQSEGAPITQSEALMKAAEVFVNEVWLGAFNGQSPLSRTRKVAIALYRWAFIRKARSLSIPVEL